MRAAVIGRAAFTARFGPGHGDGLLKALAARIARVAGDDGVAARWSGDAFLFAQAVFEDEREDTVVEHLSRPLVVRGAPDPMRLAFAETRVSTAAEVDAAIVMAETQMRAAHAS